VEVGKAKGFSDTVITENLVKKGVILMKKPSDNLVRLISTRIDIHAGEAEVISLSKELNTIAIIDDPVTRSIAELDVKKEGSYAVILRMLWKGDIRKDEAREAFRKLVESGWRCDVELYDTILNEIERF